VNGADDWNPSQPVHVEEVGATPPDSLAGSAQVGLPSASPTTTLPPPVQQALNEAAFHAPSATEGKPTGRRHDGHRRKDSSSGASTSTSTELTPPAAKPAAAEPAANPTATKSATGRRSGTLRSDDF
jgi:hypothetical protein